MTFKIAVCAGHGMNTPGKRTPDGEREWYFNDKLVRAFTKEMDQYENVEVRRFDDPTGKTDVPLETRTNRANDWGADIYISFHHNANTGKWGNWTGVETFHWGSGKSLELAKYIHPHILKAYGLRDRGLKNGSHLWIIKATKMPAVLLEGGFMDSTIDIKKLRDDSVLASSGVGVAQGVVEYAKLKKKNITIQPKPSPTPQPAPIPKPKVESVTSNNESYIGKRVECIYEGRDGINFYSKATWDKAFKVGVLTKGYGFPTIVEKVKVDGDYQYKVKNSKGEIYYVTAHPKYVKVEGVSKPVTKPTPKPQKSIDQLAREVIDGKHGSGNARKKSLGAQYDAVQKRVNELLGVKSTPKSQPKKLGVGVKVQLLSSARKYATGENIPSSIKGKTYTIMQVKSDRVLLKEIYSWVYIKDVK